MQITKVRVKDLYDLHHYEITFDSAACIKIIHAPNGYGKTTILKLIDYTMNYLVNALYSLPFRSFLICFDDEAEVEVIRKVVENQKKLIYKIGLGEKKEQFEIQEGEPVPKALIEQLENIKMEVPIHLIYANHLVEVSRTERRKGRVMPSVCLYANELSKKMKAVLVEASYRAAHLDRTYPDRLLARLVEEKKVIAKEQLSIEWADLEKKRKRLEAIGLLQKEEKGISLELEHLSDEVLETLSLFIDDSKEKLAIYDEIAGRIMVMQDIINNHFLYKKMIISLEEGFLFELPQQEKLTADKLSSGEQHELILIFELLFKSKHNAVILIDEPEISLHIAWQQSFLSDMETIAALTGVKLLIATHSPDIINGRWDLTTGLEEC